MRDLRITEKPSTECEDFEVVYTQGKVKTECDCWIDRTLFMSNNHQEFVIKERFEDVLGGDGYGFVIRANKEQVIKALKGVDWKAYAHHRAMGSSQVIGLTKADIVRAYQDHLFKKGDI